MEGAWISLSTPTPHPPPAKATCIPTPHRDTPPFPLHTLFPRAQVIFDLSSPADASTVADLLHRAGVRPPARLRWGRMICVSSRCRLE